MPQYIISKTIFYKYTSIRLWLKLPKVCQTVCYIKALGWGIPEKIYKFPVGMINLSTVVLTVLQPKLNASTNKRTGVELGKMD